jgi:hypothetical protein
MSALTKRVRQLEAELGADWRRYHIAAQLMRFATGVLVTAFWSLHSGITDWTDLVPAVWTAMWVTAAQMWPKVPWSLIRDRLHRTPPPTSTAGGVGG